MDPLSLLAGAATAVGLLLTVLNIREKLWPKAPKPHPLEAPLAAIATTIRETAPTTVSLERLSREVTEHQLTERGHRIDALRDDLFALRLAHDELAKRFTPPPAPN